MKSLVAAATVASVAIAAPAHAQPGDVMPVQALTQPQFDTVDEDTAIGLSLGGTVASWALLIAGGETNNGTMSGIGALGTLLAPSLGHWYAHQALTRGLGLRVLGATAGMVGFALVLDHLFDETSSNNDDGTAGALLLVGAGLYVAGTVDDIATAGAAARKYNSRFENVSLMPMLQHGGGGFSLTGRF